MTEFNYKHIPAKKQAEIYCKAREAVENSKEIVDLNQVTKDFKYKGDEAKLFFLQYQSLKNKKS